MSAKVQRSTVDLSSFPDLVVIYLGMRVRTLAGVKTVFRFGPKIKAAVDAKPEGLLLHENVFYSLFPLHAGMRQYWRDFASLENCPGPCLINYGGRTSCKILVELASGMKPISRVAAWKPFMTT